MTPVPVYSVVIPVYNEAAHFQYSLSVIKETLTTLQQPYEIVVVDDGSTDTTWPLLQSEARHAPWLRAVRLSRNFGKESALCAGLDIARGRAIIVMDGDLQHPPHLIPEMVRLWQETGADIVEVVKEQRGEEGVVSKLGATLFYHLFTRLSGFDLVGATDYKLLDRRVIDAWRRMGEHAPFFRGMISWLGFTRARVSFSVPERAGGTSKWSVRQQLRLALTGMVAFSSLALHLITFAGGVFLLLGLLVGGQTLFYKLSGQAVDGFTTVILLLLIIGSALMLSLGLIGEYIAKIYDEVKGRPRYVVSQITEETDHTKPEGVTGKNA